ncbi:MAG: RagB/SusD family nutrient uptake outer membrane protein [Ferruginibacter sp.]
MKLYKIKTTAIIFAGCMLVLLSCKKQLDVINPNEPTLEVTKSETGVVGFANGVVYKNGFNHVDVVTLNWLGDSYFSVCYGFHELMADVVAAEAANQSINVVNLPDYVIYDNGTRQNNTASSKDAFRLVNSRDNRPQNPVYYEWAYMYVMNSNLNVLLDLIDQASFSGDADIKKNTLKAWAYWWKGYAYSRIGSLYYAGIVTDIGLEGSRVSLYQAHDKIIEESNKNFDKAKDILTALSAGDDYTSVVGRLIPSFCQTGHGGVLTPAMWLRNINTMKARNLLANKRTKDMSAADWNALLALANDGVISGDFVFTGRTTNANGFMSAGGGSAQILATGDPAGSTYKMSERFIQEYKTGDKRLANNFETLGSPYLNQVGGFTFSTEHELLDGGSGLAGVVTLSNSTPGDFELYIAASYEENELMKAEANIYLDNLNTGLTSVDAVRQYQGAGIAAVSGTGLTPAQAKEELRRERRVALVFRGLSFYDYRRWGIIDDVSEGGGRTGCVVIESTGHKNTNATINYNFLDYWDVPDDETKLNPPAEGSAPVKNPN